LKLKEELIAAGASPGELAAFELQTRALEFNRRVGDQIRGYAEAISSGFSDLISSLMEGGRDLAKSLNSFFKTLFNQALKPGLEALQQALTKGFEKLFKDVGASVANSIMGVVGLIGMLLTSVGGGSSSTPTGAGSSITGHEAVRGVVAGETTVPIAKITTNFKEALVETNDWLREIANNTRRISPGGGGINQEAISEAVEEGMRNFYASALQMMPA